MTPQEKYTRIMEVMSDKTLGKDCMLLVNDNWNRKDSISLQTIEELYDCDSGEEGICYRISTNKIDFECSKDIINVFDGKMQIRTMVQFKSMLELNRTYFEQKRYTFKTDKEFAESIILHCMNIKNVQAVVDNKAILLTFAI